MPEKIQYEKMGAKFVWPFRSEEKGKFYHGVLLYCKYAPIIKIFG